MVLLVGADAADLHLIGRLGLRGGLGGHGVGAGAGGNGQPGTRGGGSGVGHRCGQGRRDGCAIRGGLGCGKLMAEK